MELLEQLANEFLRQEAQDTSHVAESLRFIHSNWPGPENHEIEHHLQEALNYAALGLLIHAQEMFGIAKREAEDTVYYAPLSTIHSNILKACIMINSVYKRKI